MKKEFLILYARKCFIAFYFNERYDFNAVVIVVEIGWPLWMHPGRVFHQLQNYHFVFNLMQHLHQ